MSVRDMHFGYHFGYDRGTQEALWELLGKRHWSSELNVSTAMPWAEHPGEYGNVESTNVSRRCVVIEGEVELVQELLGADFRERLQVISKRLTK